MNKTTHKTRAVRYVSCFVMLCVVSATWATSFRFLSIEERLTKAEIAFYGRVSQSEAFEQGGRVWTRVGFEVLEPFWGTFPTESEEPFSLQFLGGSLENKSLDVIDMPRFERNDEVLILAYDNDSYFSPIVGFSQGLWRKDSKGLLQSYEGYLDVDGEGNFTSNPEQGATLEEVINALEDYATSREQP